MTQDTENRLITALQKQTEKIVYFCSSENISPNLAVHEIRKSFKRIRALLKFYADCPDNFPKEMKKEIKLSGKILSPIRESFVNSQILERLTSGDNPVSERKIKYGRDLLAEKNRILTGDQFVENQILLNIHKQIEQFNSNLEILSDSCPSSKQIMKQVAETFTKSYEIYSEPEVDSTPEKRHELRKVLKRLWYQLDFIKYLHPRYFRLKSDQLNKITEQLGDDHDLYVFSEEIKNNELGFSADEITIIENQIFHQRDLNLLKLNPRLKQFFNESPEMFNNKLQKIFKVL